MLFTNHLESSYWIFGFSDEFKFLDFAEFFQQVAFMHKHNVNNSGFAAGVKPVVTPFAIMPLTTWRALMPQTVINRRDVSRYGPYRWKLLSLLKENS